MKTIFASGATALSFCLALAACQTAPPPTTGKAVTNDVADFAPADLRDTLAGLARAHQQKVQLAFYVSTPLRTIDAPFKPFYANMGKQQADLLKMITTWAKEHKIDLTFHYSPDIAGAALTIMEARQEKLVRGDSKEDFQRDMLMQMYNDYEWQISQLQALLPKVKDAGLKAYVQKSLQVHEAGSAETVALMKRYKFAG